jgi:hypothetical protein
MQLDRFYAAVAKIETVAATAVVPEADGDDGFDFLNGLPVAPSPGHRPVSPLDLGAGDRTRFIWKDRFWQAVGQRLDRLRAVDLPLRGDAAVELNIALDRFVTMWDTWLFRPGRKTESLAPVAICGAYVDSYFVSLTAPVLHYWNAQLKSRGQQVLHDLSRAKFRAVLHALVRVLVAKDDDEKADKEVIEDAGK